MRGLIRDYATLYLLPRPPWTAARFTFICFASLVSALLATPPHPFCFHAAANKANLAATNAG